MIVTDPIADMLTRMRNALQAKHKSVSIPTSKTKLAIAEVLLKEGYIASYKNEGEGINANIVIDFKNVEELSENFYKSYTKILLNTSNKIISINLNTRLTNDYGNFIKRNIVEVEE